MSKKETEFDRYERMKKLEREAEVEKKKYIDIMLGKKKKGGKPKPIVEAVQKNWLKSYDIALDEEYDKV